MIFNVRIILFGLVIATLASCAFQKAAMPVEVTYRKAMLGEGLVATFHNSSERQLAIVLKLTNPTLNKTEKYRMDLAKGVTKEVGHLEGWTFASGDVIEVVHNEYKTLKLVMP